ncbi:MAG: NPCBM/NEW2 domain-containing protein [Bacillota bacterium]
MKRWWVMVFLSAVLLLGINTATLANSVQALKSINVLSREVKIYIDGKQLKSQVAPVILADSGVTMVPLRALAEALGKTVTWDPASFSISISGGNISGGTPSQPSVESLRYDLVESLKVLRNVGPFYQQPKKPFYIAGRPFEHGIGVRVDGTSNAEMVLDLNGRYKWARGYLGVEDAARNSSGAFRLEVYGEDTRELYTSHPVRPSQYPFQFTLPSLDGVKRITFRVIWEEGSKIGDEASVLAALVDFRFYQERP